MNRHVYKEYIKEIKMIFPVKGKQERKYIKNLSNDVADFCENENIESKEELYDSYGTPIEVVSHYFSAKEVPYVVNKIIPEKAESVGFFKVSLLVANSLSIPWALANNSSSIMASCVPSA